jgi:hypothetical protein
MKFRISIFFIMVSFPFGLNGRIFRRFQASGGMSREKSQTAAMEAHVLKK